MTDQELEDLLKDKNIELLTEEDKAALLEGRVEDLSYETKQYLLDDFDTGQVMSRQFERGATSTGRGILALRGIETEDDAEKERVSRMMMDTDPVKSGVAMLGGAIVDPVVIPAAVTAPIKLATAARTGLARGALAGATYGVIEPVYEEYGDSRVLNTLVGAGFGGALGGLVGKLFGNVSPNPKKLKEAESAATEAAIRAEKDSQIKLDAAVKTMSDNDMMQGLVSQTVRNNNTNPSELRFDNTTGTINLVKTDTTPVDFDTLPPGLVNLRQSFGGSAIQFASKIDAALHKIGSTPKSKEAAALRSWLKSKDSRLTDEAIDKAAKDAYQTHTQDILPKSPVKGKVVYADQSPIAKGIFDAAQEPRVTTSPYIPQGKIKLDEAFSPDDLKIIEQALGLKPRGMYSWVDVTKKNQPFVSKQEVLWRMEQLGIEPISNEQVKAQRAARDAEFEPEAPKADLEYSPEVQAGIDLIRGVDLNGVPLVPKKLRKIAEDLGLQTKKTDTPESLIERIRAAVNRATQQAEQAAAAPSFPGMPKTMGSVGARGVRPETRYAEDLGGPLYKKYMKGQISESELVDKIIDGQGDIRDREYLRNKNSGKPRYMGIRGMNEIVRGITKGEYNDIVDMIIQRDRKGQDPLPPEIVTALRREGFDTYVENQVRSVAKDMAKMKKNGESPNSKKGMGLLEEWYYYSGLHLAFENQKTYASRSLYAWRRQGFNIKESHPMASIFPGVKC